MRRKRLNIFRLIRFLARTSKRYFDPPDASRDSLDRVDSVAEKYSFSSEQFLILSEQIRKENRLKNLSSFSFYILKILFTLATIGYILYKITDLIVVILSKFTELIVKFLDNLTDAIMNSATGIAPFISYLVAFLVLVVGWEVFSSIISTSKRREIVLRRLGLGRWKERIDQDEKDIELRKIEDRSDKS